MQRPDFGDNKLRQAGRGFLSFCENGFSRHLLRHLLFVLPPAAAIYLLREGKSADLSKLGEFGDFLQQSSLILLGCAWFWVIACKEAYSLLQKYSKPSKELTRDDVLKVLESVSRVVSEKATRMAEQSDALCRKNSINSGQIFVSITRPEEQLKLLTTAVHSVFSALDKDNGAWKARLCLVRKGVPERWFYWEPYETTPRLDPSDLSAPTSTLSRCIKARDLIVVENMAAELEKRAKENRRCVRGNAESFSGSLLCVPVGRVSCDDASFVLCISSDRPFALKEDLKELYAWILQHFLLRFSIETSLFRLKEKINEPANQDASQQAA